MDEWIEKIKRNHRLLMLLCCGIPLVLLLAAVYFFGINKIYLTWFVILLCPIMHLFMMRSMHKEHKEKGAGVSGKTEDNKAARNKKEQRGCH